MTHELSDDDILKTLGAAPDPKKKAARTPREERVIAGFEDIQKFHSEHGRLPLHGSDRDIFERIYATRLDALRRQAECQAILKELDTHGWLEDSEGLENEGEIDDDTLLAALDAQAATDQDDISTLKHVRTRAPKTSIDRGARPGSRWRERSCQHGTSHKN